jgi:hypothetical protein
MAPEPPPVLSATAATRVADLPQKDGTGIRLDFATGEADLTQATADAVKALAAGVPEDPSTARRLSLSRALAVRSALIAYGVPSERIYVHALGAQGMQGGDGPADRVDVMVMGANAAAPHDTGTRNP